MNALTFLHTCNLYIFLEFQFNFDRSAIVNALKLYKNEKQVNSHLTFTVDLNVKQDAKLVSSKASSKMWLSIGGSASQIWDFSCIQG